MLVFTPYNNRKRWNEQARCVEIVTTYEAYLLHLEAIGDAWIKEPDYFTPAVGHIWNKRLAIC